MYFPKPFQKKLSQSNTTVVAIYAAVIAFCTYSCMYAFRKPFSVATFDGETYLGINIKILFVIAQLVGYTLSKFVGIKVVSEIKHHQRAYGIIGLITFSMIGLLLLPFVSAPFTILCFFLNGIPLGMVWGFVFSYLEGRKATEFMGSVLAVSFIFSSGFVKSVGKWLMKYMHVSEYWMPFTTAMLFFFPMLVAVFLLEQIPKPTREDEALRTPRLPMTQKERKSFITHFLPGIIFLVVTYVLLSVVRDFRDNFVADIWKELGNNDASVFTSTETPISIAILICMSLLMVIKNNFRALQINHYMIIVGFVVTGLSTFAFTQQCISAFFWIMLSGLGLYLGYIPFNVMLFDRLIASSRKAANVGFLIYIADAFGYLGSIAVLLFKNFNNATMSYSHFFIIALYGVSVIGILLTMCSLIYFNHKLAKQNI
jgi:hypothetical protein